ncbi:MAG: Isochorismatase-like protein [Benjaminiella poitrasii]|nr:MAG: Isochorismatase-like protein [Benjaminiella poitrasii]KAI9483626.1 MAG: Isochorismatase-like protein [Benjaminiella poitrasii]
MSEALIIVDVQNDYFPGGALPTWRPVETAEACAKLIEKFRKENKEVVHIQHIMEEEQQKEWLKISDKPWFAKGSKGAEIHDLVKPLPTEKIVVKSAVSGFVGTDLTEYLTSKGVKKLIVVGMMIHNCVNATVYSGVEEGFQCIVVDEAVNTLEQKIHGKPVKPEVIKESFMAGLQFSYADVYKLDDVLNDNYKYEKQFVLSLK